MMLHFPMASLPDETVIAGGANRFAIATLETGN